MPQPRRSLARMLLPTLALSLGAGSQLSAQTFFTVDPRGSYLRTTSDVVVSPLFIPLSTFGGAGSLFLQPEGILQVAGSGSPRHNAMFCGVFSSSTELLAPGQQFRLPGSVSSAASLAEPCRTSNTFNGRVPTDIADDFLVPFIGWEVGVPTGAAYLAIAVPDDFYADNVSPDPSRYGIRITAIDRAPVPVPEPTSGLLLLAGLAALCIMPARARLQAETRA